MSASVAAALLVISCSSRLAVGSSAQGCDAATGARNASLVFELPASGSRVGLEYEVRFRVLSGDIIPGSLRMIWDSVDDSTGPHFLEFSDEVSKPGRHRFEMQRFSVAAASMDEVAAAVSSGGAARDLVRGVAYNVTLAARFPACDDANETTVVGVSHWVEQWDVRWVWGVSASLVSSLGSTLGMLIQKRAITSNENKI